MNQNALNWISNLRSGKFKQSTGALCKMHGDHSTYCCLGVIAETGGVVWEPIDGSERREYMFPFGSSCTSPPRQWMANYLGISEEQATVIRDWGIHLNDALLWNFEGIARAMEYGLTLCSNGVKSEDLSMAFQTYVTQHPCKVKNK